MPVDPSTAASAVNAGISIVNAIGGIGSARRARQNAARLQGTSEGFLGDAATLRPRYNAMATAGENGFKQFAPQAVDATQRYVNHLEQDPYTDTYGTAVINKGTAGLTDAYLRGRASTAATLARRGVTDSNVGVGATAFSEVARAGQIGQGQVNLGQQKVQDNDARMRALVSVLTGAKDNYQSDALTGLGQVNNLDMSLSGAYGNLAANAKQEAGAAAGGAAQGVGDLSQMLAAIMAAKNGGGGGFTPSIRTAPTSGGDFSAFNNLPPTPMRSW